MAEFHHITTRGGDSGETSLADGSRRPKDDLLIDVLGEVDELHAALGLLKASLTEILETDDIDWLERSLLRVGGMLAVPAGSPIRKNLDEITDDDIDDLEQREKDVMDRVKIPQKFITYGSSEPGARADFARAVCRRTERRLVNLIRQRGMRELAPAQRFINRLSDFLFVLARDLDRRYPID